MNIKTSDVVRLPGHRRNALALAVVAITVSPPTLAQEETRALEPIEVSADREATSDRVVTDERLERYQADDLEDVSINAHPISKDLYNPKIDSNRVDITKEVHYKELEIEY